MKKITQLPTIVLGISLLAGNVLAQDSATPYKVLDTTKLMGSGGIDFVYADNDGRRVYVPRGGQTFVFDLDGHQYIGAITNCGGRGVVVDTASHHGFSTAGKIGMFDTETMQKIKDIEVGGRPDGIMLEPLTDRVYILSHEAPSLTVIDPKDGSVVGTVDVGGDIEQAQSDGQGKMFLDVENEKKIAVVDVKALKLITKYDLGDTAGEPSGLGLDIKHHILFAMCANPDVCVVVNADDGKVLATLPLDGGTDGGGFNPATMEAWSSQRNGTLTIIKESSPTSFAVEQTVQTKAGCKTSALDTKNNRIVLICTEQLPQATPATNAAPVVSATATTTNAPGGGQRRGGGRGGPGNLCVLWVGR
jgi:DNA-binding beta-propeller fold protein YncE